MVSHHLFLLLFLLLVVGVAQIQSDLASDRAALLRLRSVVGNNRTCRWNESEASPCSWRGVYCNHNATAVVGLRLPRCFLSGQIPPNSIGSLTSLQVLSLRLNSLSAPLPDDLSSCTQLHSLFLQDNTFSGQIPPTLFALTNLARLTLARNRFTGHISPGFNSLIALKNLELESNNFSGSIPELNLSGLQKFNVSHNQLNGSIPPGLSRFSSDSFEGNALCGSPLAACPSNNDGNGNGNGNGSGGKKLSTGAIIGIIVGSVIGLILILLIVVMFFLLRRSPSRQAETHLPPPVWKPPVLDLEFDTPKMLSPRPLIVREASGWRSSDTVVVQSDRGDDGLVFFGEGSVAFSLEGLLTAPAEVLGKGTFGYTYKAYLEGETELAVVVKRLRDVCVSEREFRDKVEDLGMLVHHNLVPLRAYYCGREEKLIVFDCMPMGSLSALLHGTAAESRAALTWKVRSKIALGAARGIEYLHSLGSNVSHGNIKSSNILLTHFYAACVSEYGICQLVSPTTTSPLSLDDQNENGPCRAPEVTDSRIISHQADVYSFGVLLLELLTGKEPTPNHGFLNNKGVDLPRWVRSMMKDNQMVHVFDQELLRQHNDNTTTAEEEQMVELLRLGLHCTSWHPEKRPSMVEVTREIGNLVT